MSEQYQCNPIELAESLGELRGELRSLTNGQREIKNELVSLRSDYAKVNSRVSNHWGWTIGSASVVATIFSATATFILTRIFGVTP